MLKYWTFFYRTPYSTLLGSNTNRVCIIICFRCVPILLGAVLHLQYPGCDLQKTGQGLLARCPDVHTNYVARIHKQLRQPRNLYDIQPGIPQSVQKIDANRNLTRGRRHRQKFRHENLRKLTTTQFIAHAQNVM